MKNLKSYYLGKEYKTTEGYIITVVGYKNSQNIEVRFSDGLVVKVHMTSLKSGKIKNPNHRSVYGVGYIGVGKYEQRIKGVKQTKAYEVWRSMLTRCYSHNSLKKDPSYTSCTVDERWHNFQVFAEWYYENYIEGYHLDKDILVKGNKIYSHGTCCFVPQEINKLFTNRKNKRGDCPIGVYIKAGKFVASVSTGKKFPKMLGYFKTVEEAFQAYKIAKEKRIKELADQWKTLISDKVYQAMVKYKVQITD